MRPGGRVAPPTSIVLRSEIMILPRCLNASLDLLASPVVAWLVFKWHGWNLCFTIQWSRASTKNWGADLITAVVTCIMSRWIAFRRNSIDLLPKFLKLWPLETCDGWSKHLLRFASKDRSKSITDMNAGIFSIFIKGRVATLRLFFVGVVGNS